MIIEKPEECMGCSFETEDLDDYKCNFDKDSAWLCKYCAVSLDPDDCVSRNMASMFNVLEEAMKGEAAK